MKSKDIMRVLSFDDIVFRIRNKEYGAFVLRKSIVVNIIYPF